MDTERKSAIYSLAKSVCWVQDKRQIFARGVEKQENGSETGNGYCLSLHVAG